MVKAICLWLGALTLNLGGQNIIFYNEVPQYVENWVSQNRLQTEDVAMLKKAADQPHGFWFGNWNLDVQADVNALLARAESYAAKINLGSIYQKKVLVGLSIYNRYQRDACSGFSGGGSETPQAYKNWISRFKAGIKNTSSNLIIVVLVEPDSLGEINCLNTSDELTRIELINYAVDSLNEVPNVLVFLDGANSEWPALDNQKPTWTASKIMADRLARAGVKKATGFSANVSGFVFLSQTLVYVTDVYNILKEDYGILVGGVTIDTGRNGRGPLTGSSLKNPWCNPPERALGDRPQFELRYKFPILLYWWKVVLESDGNCREGDPVAGEFYPNYAIGLASRALW